MNKPANNSSIFGQAIFNPKRDQADELMIAAVDLMVDQEIPRETIARAFADGFFHALNVTAGKADRAEVEILEDIRIAQELRNRLIHFIAEMDEARGDSVG